ncbi:hypothetical protein [Nannocystis radixulma]|uniref:C-type lysozyme inhibitor domain-containing protein n=1 Tax=Nannocystis radixulma TaxID=2995305 RepID=A0ABT5BM48_9BACT|nr:hypothetical protein [Nannocystis radixulma]MDC0674483.1 hypothetical protein [Nannocystis radixulma]
MSLRLALSLALLLSACRGGSTPSTESPTTPSAEPAATDGLPPLESAGRRYAGAPVGGRGGNYELSLCPDGSYQYRLLDATEGGHWVREGDALVLTGDGGSTSRITFSADERLIASGGGSDDMKFEGVPECKGP